MKQVQISSDRHKKLKFVALKKDKRMQEIMDEAFDYYVKEHNLINEEFYEKAIKEAPKNERISLIREYNYKQFTKHLNARNEHISKSLFSATLYAINGMTAFNYEKDTSIENASKKYNEDQATIKKYIHMVKRKDNK